MLNNKEQQEANNINLQIDRLNKSLIHPYQITNTDLDSLELKINSIDNVKEKERLISDLNNVRVKVARNKANRDSVVNEAAELSKNALEKVAKLEKKKTNSPFNKFVQINKNQIPNLVILAQMDKMAIAIFLFMLDKMDNYNALVCSYNVFCQVFQVSRMTVSRAIKKLVEYGFITVVKSGTSNVYILNKTIVWNSWGTNYNYCSFDAKVIISSEENKNLIQKIKEAKVQKANIVK